MSMLFFLKPFLQFDAERPDRDYEHSRRARKKRALKRIYEVPPVIRGPVVAKELATSKRAVRLIEESIDFFKDVEEVAKMNAKIAKRRRRRSKEFLLLYQLMDD